MTKQMLSFKEIEGLKIVAGIEGITTIKLTELMILRLRELRYHQALDDIQEIVDANPSAYPDVALILRAALQDDGLGGELNEVETENL